MKSRSLIFCFILFCFQAAAQVTDTFSVFFPLNQSQLSPEATQQLDSLFYTSWLQEGRSLILTGFADELGGFGDYNDALSQRRAAVVAAYLKAGGIRSDRLILVQGLGAIEREGRPGRNGVATDRRVTIARSTTGIRTVKEPAPLTNDDEFSKALTQLRPGDVLTLENIHFFPSRHVVRPESIESMKALLRQLQQIPTLRIRIEGHVCCITEGTDAIDLGTGKPQLSENRARYIYRWLIANGVSKDRLEWKGFGRSRPLISEEQSEAEANLNRRVEIRVLSR